MTIDQSFFYFLSFSTFFFIARCRLRTREEAAADREEGLRAFRRARARRRARSRREERDSSAPPRRQEDNEEEEGRKEERERLVKSALFRRRIERGEESAGSAIRSMLSLATSEERDEDGRGSFFVARSWRVASHNIRALARERCSICFDKYERGDVVACSKRGECNHIFHEDCISQWLQKHDECPLCRTNLTAGVDTDTDTDEEEGREGTAINERGSNDATERETNDVAEDERSDTNESESNATNEGARGSNNTLCSGSSHQCHAPLLRV